MKYKILATQLDAERDYYALAIGMETLTNEVNEFIKKGWIPQGGVTCQEIGEDACIMQAMILREENDK